MSGKNTKGVIINPLPVKNTLIYKEIVVIFFTCQMQSLNTYGNGLQFVTFTMSVHNCHFPFNLTDIQ